MTAPNKGLNEKDVLQLNQLSFTQTPTGYSHSMVPGGFDVMS